MDVNVELRCHPLVFVEDLESPQISPPDVDHLVRSLRLSAGDRVNLSDGAGSWAGAVLTSNTGSVDVVSNVVSAPPKPTALGVGFAPTKGVKPEAVVKKLTELGINHIALLQSTRSVVTYNPARAERLMRRLRVTAREACQQSRRVHLPEVSGVFALEEFVGSHDTVTLAEPGGGWLWTYVLPARTTLWVAIGPEGGWSEAERSLAEPVALPGGILRSETAAVAAGVVLASLREQQEMPK